MVFSNLNDPIILIKHWYKDWELSCSHLNKGGKAVSLQILAKVGFCQRKQFTHKRKPATPAQCRFHFLFLSLSCTTLPVLWLLASLYHFAESGFCETNLPTSVGFFPPKHFNLVVVPLKLLRFLTCTWCCRCLWERMIRASKTAVGAKTTFYSSYIDSVQQRISISHYPLCNDT